MKILCSYSGLELQITYFPGTIERGEVHPVFSLPQKRLLSYLGKWSAQELTPPDSYLLFLALLNSTGKVEFRLPALRAPNTEAIVANNMEALAKVVYKINEIVHPAFSIPTFVISQETRSLETITQWIDTWESNIKDFNDGYRSFSLSRALLVREEALERLIKHPTRKVDTYAHILADWAEIAGSFPSFLVTTPSGEKKTCSTYWKSIISKCCKGESIFSIPSEDLKELITHCEDNIIHGSIFAHSLMDLLKRGREKQTNFLGLGDTDISGVTFKILSPTDSVEDANLQALIDSAPTSAPVEREYPSKLAYLRAKLKWETAERYKKEAVNDSMTTPEGDI